MSYPVQLCYSVASFVRNGYFTNIIFNIYALSMEICKPMVSTGWRIDSGMRTSLA